jgi:voltage-gated potassium channel Kch/multidrug transporter EmrE-like cation transporter
VTVLLHGDDRLSDAIAQHLIEAGCPVSRLQADGAAGGGLNAAVLQRASVLVLTSNDDATNVDLALTARRQQADLPMVVRIFEEALADYLNRTLSGVTTLSMSGLAAPAFAKATTDAIASRSISARAARAVTGTSVRHRRSNADRVVPAVVLGFFVLVTLLTVFFANALNLPYLDAAYFVWTTITTVGYGDIALRDASSTAKVVGMGMMVAGAAGFAVLFGLFADWVIARRLEILSGRVSVRGKGHIVIAGAGNIGVRVASQLYGDGHRVVIIERDGDNKNIDALRSARHLVILGDASRADTLALARVAEAAAMVCLTDSDAVNFQIAVLVRAHNSAVPLVMRLASPELSAHVSEHGEAVAISPTAIAGREFAAAALAIRTMDQGLRTDQGPRTD